MSALTQYLRLAADNAELLARGSNGVVNNARRMARAVLETFEGEDPRKLDRRLLDLFAPDYGINLARMDWGTQAAASLGCAVPRIPAILVIVAGDSVAVPQGELPPGVEIRSLRHCPTEVLGEHYAKIMPLERPEVALNTLLVQDGVFIKIDKGVSLDRPIQILNVLHAPVPQLAVRRVYVHMGAGARASVLTCDHTQDDTQHYLVSRVTEAYMASGSHLDWCDLEESSPLTGRVNGFYALMRDGATLNANHTTLQGGLTHNDVEISLDAPDAEASLSGMVIADDSQDTLNRTLIRHQAPHCRSHQLYKHIADGESRVTFDGLVNVRPGAVGTDARQAAHTILASEGARVHAEPHLIIDCDDVKCSHGATTGTLDEDALFYMRQRGIPLAEARRMLMQAFMQQVIDTVPLEGLRQSLHTLVDRRLSGQRVNCAGCHARQ